RCARRPGVRQRQRLRGSAGTKRAPDFRPLLCRQPRFVRWPRRPRRNPLRGRRHDLAGRAPGGLHRRHAARLGACTLPDVGPRLSWVLAWTLAAPLVAGVLSVLAAAAFALRARPAQVSLLVSYAIGTLLGAAFLEILPQAFERSGNPARVSATVLIGILLFFLLEKLMLWRHHHEGPDDAAHTDHGRIATMVIVGDTFHNCVDGVIIAGSFLVSVELGLITALAVITHEIPQEVGDFLVLLHSGYSKSQAFAFNILSSIAMVIGGAVAY